MGTEPFDHLGQEMTCFMRSSVLGALAELDLGTTILQNGNSLGAAELARLCACDERGAEALLDALEPFADECYFHSLATCQGELVDEPVEVTITDADGVVLVEESATTYSNGFVGYWLPEDVEGTIEITQGDLSGNVPFSTTEGSPTCVTTLQLT